MNWLVIVAIMVIVVVLWNVIKYFTKAIKEIMSIPVAGAAATLKGINKFRYKLLLWRVSRRTVKEAKKLMFEFAINSLENGVNGYSKSAKLQDMEQKLSKFGKAK